MLLLPFGTLRVVAADEPPSVSLGSGRSMVVEYDLDFKPLRKYLGLDRPVDITPLPDGTFLLVDQGTRRVLLFDSTGTVRWSDQIGTYPLRARLRPTGGFLVTSGDQVFAMRADRTVEWERRVKNISAAVMLPNGNVLTATNEGNGWLTETTPDSRTVWQSKAPLRRDAAGHWIEEEHDRYFKSLASLDVAQDGTIFTAEFDGNQMLVLTPEHELLRTLPSPGPHVTDARTGPAGELIAVSPEAFRVWVALPDGRTKSFQPDLRPTCANISRNGTLLVGLIWEPEDAVLNASAPQSKKGAAPWWQHPLPVAGGGLFLGLLMAVVVRWQGAWNPARSSRPDHRSPHLPAQGTATQGRAVLMLERAGLRPLVVSVCVTSFLVGLYLAWTGIRQIESSAFSVGGWRFAIGCVAAAMALRALNALIGCARTLSAFVVTEWRPPARHAGLGASATLTALSISATGVCLLFLLYRPQEQALAVGLWLAAQIWMIAAAYPPVSVPDADRTARWLAGPVVGLLLMAAVVTRFWQIGDYPDFIHHDHSQYGWEGLQILHGDWRPFFTLDPAMSAMARPWLVPLAAGLKLFGTHFWVLRLTAALSGVVVVWGTYLLGTSLFNRRIGLIGAFLATVNQVLLLYSRLPYMIDSAAPFILSLYCAATGIRRGCRLRWCLAGMLSGWAMLTVRSFTMFPFIGGAIFLYLFCVHPRAMWRQRVGIFWFTCGAAVVYLPMVPHMLVDPSLRARAKDQFVLLFPDGSIRRDPVLWTYQLGRSFGSLFYYGDSAPWGVTAGTSICMSYGSCLFGIGLVYLLMSWRSPATFIIVVWIILSIFLGSALLPSPPTFYHFLVAISAVMLASAVALDRALALTDRWRSVWRALALGAALLLLGAVGISHLNAVLLTVQRPLPRQDGPTPFRAPASVLAARFIREHADDRHYLIRSRTDIGCKDALFQFASADSDLSNLTTALGDALPVPPVEPATGASFIVLPSRAMDRQAISTVYPTATVQQLVEQGLRSVWIYRVDAATVRRVFTSRHSEAPTLAVQP